MTLQRRFLWGGNEENKKVAWVSWKSFCKPKSKGGLGVKNLEAFNLALLVKWRWKFLVERDDAIWKKVLISKYGAGIPWLNNESMKEGLLGLVERSY